MSTAEKKFYQENAAEFGWGETNAKLDSERLELIYQNISGKKVLDVGCGFGLYVDYLSSLGFESFGVDFIEEFIKKAKKNKEGTFVKSRAEKLPFKNSFFDTVLLFDVLEHGDDLKILKEVKRVTKKKVLIIVPRTVDKKLSESGVIFRHYLDKTHLREYSQKDLQNIAKKVGLSLILVKPIHKLNNKTIFLSLFKGQNLLNDIIRKLVFMFLPRREYPTEFFAVLEKA